MALPFTNSIRRQGPTTLILSDEEPCLLTTASWITSFAVTQITNISCCEIPSSSFCDFWKSILPVLLHHLILLYYLCHEFSSIPVVLHIVAFLKRQPFPMITTMVKVKIITIILVLLMIYVKNYQEVYTWSTPPIWATPARKRFFPGGVPLELLEGY